MQALMQEGDRGGRACGVAPHGGSKPAPRPVPACAREAGSRRAAAGLLGPHPDPLVLQSRVSPVGPTKTRIDILRHRLDGSTDRTCLVGEMIPPKTASTIRLYSVSLGAAVVKCRRDAPGPPRSARSKGGGRISVTSTLKPTRCQPLHATVLEVIHPLPIMEAGSAAIWLATAVRWPMVSPLSLDLRRQRGDVVRAGPG